MTVDLTTPRLTLQIPTFPFNSEQSLADHLLAQTDPTTYLYRGQSREYRRRWPLVPQQYRPLSQQDLVDPNRWRFDPPTTQLPIPLLPGTLDLPSLIPTNTRAYEKFLANPTPDLSENAFEDMMVYFWTTVCLFITGLACIAQKDTSALTWLAHQWSSDFPRLYKLRSIGQHYGLETGLMDATSSVPVALWFATHDFANGHYRANSSGIVYRIDRAILTQAEKWLEALPEHEGEFDATTIDIRDTPPGIAPRASRQHGWSLVGWDHPRLITKVVACGGLEQYTFPTGLSPSRANYMTRDWLVPDPDHDPVRKRFEFFWTNQPRSLNEAQQWIDKYWNLASTHHIQLDDEGNWLDQLSSEFARIFDYYSTS